MRRRLLYIVLASIIVASFLFGYMLAQRQAELSKAALEEKLSKLEEERDFLRKAKDKLEDELSELLEKLSEKRAELEEVKKRLNSTERLLKEAEERLTKIGEETRVLMMDKELLMIIASELPESREEAEILWNNARSLIERIEPNLLPSIERVLSYMDAYYDWYESLPQEPTCPDVCAWLSAYSLEADQYLEAVNEFRRDAAGLVASHINRVMEELG